MDYYKRLENKVGTEPAVFRLFIFVFLINYSFADIITRERLATSIRHEMPQIENQQGLCADKQCVWSTWKEHTHRNE